MNVIERAKRINKIFKAIQELKEYKKEPDEYFNNFVIELEKRSIQIQIDNNTKEQLKEILTAIKKIKYNIKNNIDDFTIKLKIIN